jgi:transposase
MKVLGMAEGFTGIAIHDSWSSYWSPALEKATGHGLCNAHHLRELAAVTELDGQRWSGRMSDLLLELLDRRNAAMAAGRSALEPAVITELEQRYELVIRAGWRENPGRRRGWPLSKAGNLLRRLEERRTEVLRFLHDFRVPFTNNEIERDLRMTKLHEKISGGLALHGRRPRLPGPAELPDHRSQARPGQVSGAGRRL